MADPIKCPHCKRMYNSKLALCPFCNKSANERPAGPVARDVRDYAAAGEDAVERHRPLLDLDFSFASVHTLDVYIAEMWGTKGESPRTETWEMGRKGPVIYSIGCYFGEVLRRQWGGTWREDPNRPGDMLFASVQLAAGLSCYPIARVFKRFKEGESDGLEAMVIALRSKFPQTRDDAGPWLRQAGHFERVKRPDLALSFYERALKFQLEAPLRAQVEAAYQRGLEAEKKHQAAEADVEAAERARRLDFALAEKEAAPIFTDAGGKMDHSPASFIAIDVWLDKQFGPQPWTQAQRNADSYKELEWQLGSYLGNMLCKRFGATWVPNYDDRLCSHVQWPSGFVTTPFVFISKRAETGAGHTVSRQLSTLFELLEQRKELPSRRAEAPEWIAHAVEYLARFPERTDIALAMAGRSLRLDPEYAPGFLRIAEWTLLSAAGPNPAASETARKMLDKALQFGGTDGAMHLGRAKVFMLMNDVESGLESANRAAQMMPDDARVHALQGLLLVAAGRTEEACASYKEALRLDENNAEIWLRYGDAERAAGRIENAVTAWQRGQSMRARGPEPETWWQLGGALAELGRWQEARRAFQSLTTQPGVSAELVEGAKAQLARMDRDPRWLKAEADQLAAQQQIPRAIDMYRRVIEVAPNDADAWREYGVGLAMAQRWDDALRALDRAIHIAPDDARGWDHKAVTLGRMNRFTEGLAVLEAAVARLPNAAVLWSRRAFFLIRNQRVEEARVSADRAIYIDPETTEAYWFRGEAERHLGQTAAAIHSMKAYLQRDLQGPRSVAARRLLYTLENPDKRMDPQAAAEAQQMAFTLMQQGRSVEALQAFKQAAELDPVNLELWNNFGTALAGAGRSEEALAAYNHAIEIAPRIDVVWHNKAGCLARMGRWDDALECHRTVLSWQPKNVESLSESARLLGILNRHQEALPVAEALLQETPKDVKAHTRLAYVLSQLSRHEDAIRAYDRAIALEPNNRKLWVEKSTILNSAGRKDEGWKLLQEAMSDEEFADQYDRETQALFSGILSPAESKPVN